MAGGFASFLDAERAQKDHMPVTGKEFRFLYLLSIDSMLRCIYSSEGAVELTASPAGSSLRHWPPGTNSSTVRAVFFCAQKCKGECRGQNVAGSRFPWNFGSI
jgi:hypothetical protein